MHSGSFARAVFAVAMFSALLAAPRAMAGDAAAGETIVKQWCVPCHALSGASSARDAAPPFSAIAASPDFDEAQLRGWLADPHPPMPNISLSRQQIEHLVTYIRSLKNAR